MSITALIEAIRKGAQVKNLGDGRYSIPDDAQIIDYQSQDDARLPRPRRHEGTVTLHDLASFVAWTNRHSVRHSSAVYANPEQVTVVINDNSSTASAAPLSTEDSAELTAEDFYEEPEPEQAPGWGDFRGVWPLPYSREWTAWHRLNKSYFDQKRFAEFLEDHIMDVIDEERAGESATRLTGVLGMKVASPSAMLTLSRGLSIRVDSRMSNVQSLSSGEAQMHYSEEHRDEKGAPLKIPGGFVVAIPVFRGGPLWKIPVRLRYRVSKGEVQWSYHLHRADAVASMAFDEAVEAIREQTGLPVFQGTPPKR